MLINYFCQNSYFLFSIKRRNTCGNREVRSGRSCNAQGVTPTPPTGIVPPGVVLGGSCTLQVVAPPQPCLLNFATPTPQLGTRGPTSMLCARPPSSPFPCSDPNGTCFHLGSAPPAGPPGNQEKGDQGILTTGSEVVCKGVWGHSLGGRGEESRAARSPVTGRGHLGTASITWGRKRINQSFCRQLNYPQRTLLVSCPHPTPPAASWLRQGPEGCSVGGSTWGCNTELIPSPWM